MRVIAFHQTAFDDYRAWAKIDRKLFERIYRLIVETAKTPFDGIGKPEPLKGDLKGYWSRRSRTSIDLFIKRQIHTSSSSLANTTTSEHTELYPIKQENYRRQGTTV